MAESFRIPFLVVGAGEIGMDSALHSQLDVLPTLIEVLGFEDSYASLGASLLSGQPGWAIVKRGSVLGIITPELQLQHSLQRRLDVRSDLPHIGEETISAAERKLLATYRVTSELLRLNRWHAPLASRAR